MHNVELARDSIARAELWLRAVDTLFEGGSWADVVRESQKVVELAFYGAEDLTPSTFYVRADATRARDAARWVVQQVKRGEI